jgi:hypothetical protein
MLCAIDPGSADAGRDDVVPEIMWTALVSMRCRQSTSPSAPSATTTPMNDIATEQRTNVMTCFEPRKNIPISPWLRHSPTTIRLKHLKQGNSVSLLKHKLLSNVSAFALVVAEVLLM